jgi:hypothetical protein
MISPMARVPQDSNNAANARQPVGDNVYLAHVYLRVVFLGMKGRSSMAERLDYCREDAGSIPADSMINATYAT